MSLAAFGVRKPVVASLVMWAVIIAGVLFGLKLRREFFPESRADRVVIAVPYPGASPEEIERSLVIKIEDRIERLRGVKEITSSISEGGASISVEFEHGIDIEPALAEVKREVDALQDLPERAERITVSKFEPNLPAIVLSLHGGSDETAMKEAIRQVRDDLRTLPKMGDIEISGTRRDEISVEVRPEALLEHGLSLTQVAARVRQAMQELPAGTLRNPSQSVPVRTVAVEEHAQQVRGIVVAAGGEGRLLTLGDIADVRRAYQDVDVLQRLNGETAVSLTVFKVGDEDAVNIAEMVKAYAAGRRGETIEPDGWERASMLMGGQHPVSNRLRAYELGRQRAGESVLPGQLTVTTDLARFIVGRLHLLTDDVGAGAFLVFLTLILTLNWRAAWWVNSGMVVSLLGTLVVMYAAGITLNLLTMVGLIIVIGIVVDDSIVIAENITAKHEAGMSPQEAAVRGTDEIAWPVIGTVATMTVAFMPLLLLEGRIGDLMGVLPIVVGIALVVSLVETLFLLPVHMSKSLAGVDKRKAAGKRSWIDIMDRRMAPIRVVVFDKWMVPAYAWALERCLRHRYMTMCAVIAMWLASLGMVAGGRVPFSFLASSDAETINGELRMPIGTPAARTNEVAALVEAAAVAMPEVKSVYVNVGNVGSLDGNSPNSNGGHLAQIILELQPVEMRDKPAEAVISELRRSLGNMAGVKSFRLEEIGGGGSGADINLGLVGDDTEELLAVAVEIKAALRDYEGVFDITDDAEQGQREARFTLRSGASELGFTQASVGEQVRGMVYGLEPYTFAGEREDVDVRVTFPAGVRRSLGDLERQHVFTPEGVAVPLGEVVEFEMAESFASVRRLNRERIVSITADVDSSVASPEAVVADLQPALDTAVARHPGVRLEVRGRQKDMADSFSSLPLAMLMAMAMIYVILAWLFGSYTQPLLILTNVPLSVIGMIWGHWVLGFELTIISLIGGVALAGGVVNDAVVFTEFYNINRRAGMSVFGSCMKSGRERIRAIVLTTFTTVIGMGPLIMEQSFQARFLIPMAITLAGGLIAGTLLTLIVLPALLLILDDARRLGRLVWRGESEPPAEASGLVVQPSAVAAGPGGA